MLVEYKHKGVCTGTHVVGGGGGGGEVLLKSRGGKGFLVNIHIGWAVS